MRWRRRRSSSQSKGWQSGERWAYEVNAPQNADCSIGTPDITMPIGEWVKRGFVPARRKLSAPAFAQPASLLQPEGSYGPSFLTPKNYFVIKEYNFSDLYVLFVGHLTDRIGGAKSFETPWSKSEQLKTSHVEAMQERLTQLGLYKDKIDGKAGMMTRAALGEYQKTNGLKVDCWPTAAVLAICGAETHHARLLTGHEVTGSSCVRSVADFDAAVTPAIAIPKALTLHVADRALDIFRAVVGARRRRRVVDWLGIARFGIGNR